jgi:hypothetical protein
MLGVEPANIPEAYEQLLPASKQTYLLPIRGAQSSKWLKVGSINRGAKHVPGLTMVVGLELWKSSKTSTLAMPISQNLLSKWLKTTSLSHLKGTRPSQAMMCLLLEAGEFHVCSFSSEIKELISTHLVLPADGARSSMLGYGLAALLPHQTYN